MRHPHQILPPDQAVESVRRPADRRVGRQRAVAAWGLVRCGEADGRRHPPALALAPTPRVEPVDPGGFSMSGFG